MVSVLALPLLTLTPRPSPLTRSPTRRANTLCRDKAKMDRKKIEDMEYASMLLRGVLLYLIHPDTRDMYEDGGERFPTAVHSKDQPTIELFKDVLHIKGVQVGV